MVVSLRLLYLIFGQLLSWLTLSGARTRLRRLNSGFQAAASYSLIKPPSMDRRRILARIGEETGGSGRGGRSFSDRCGRFRL
jgi:hypothetical protein